MSTKVPSWMLRNAVLDSDPLHCAVEWLDREQQQRYCNVIGQGASMHYAASLLGFPFMAVMRTVHADEQFAKDLEAAKDFRGKFALEEFLLEQCTIGVDEQLVYQGHPVLDPETQEPLTVKKLLPNNSSLQFLLKANNPEKFRDKQEIWHHGGDGDDEHSGRITNESDRTKLLNILSKRAADHAQLQNDDDVENEDLL